MRLAILPIIAWCVLTASIARAAPARRLYEPLEQPRAPEFDLRDTQWHGPEAADHNIFFHADGTLGYTRGQKAFGTWKLDGNVLTFEFNKRYREFRGVIRGDVIQGESWNVAGKRWQSLLKRASVPQSGAAP